MGTGIAGAATPLIEVLNARIRVPVWGGTAPSVNLDNAATTAELRRVRRAVESAMPWYGSLHRGAGYSSVISTGLLERARARILRFAGGSAQDMAIFSQNSTSSMSIVARRLAQVFGSGFGVVASAFEHSTNLLPWLRHGQLHVCPVDLVGDLNLNDLDAILRTTQARVVTITAASNVTGRLLNVGAVAEVAHGRGALLVVDASQFVAHRSLREASARVLWDIVVFAGHKMYAPYGVGVLVAPAELFQGGWPDRPGGGTVRLIDGTDIVWAGLPAREDGGTPNYPGLVALAEACTTLEDVGFDAIERHEQALSVFASEVLGGLTGITFHRPLDEDPRWLPVFPFTVKNYHHAHVAAYLGMERGIAVRSGHLCQYELTRKLTETTTEQRRQVLDEARAGNLRNMYGVVRASAGPSTTTEDIRALAEALQTLVTTGPSAEYAQESDGHFRIVGWQPPAPAELSFSW